MTTTETKVFNSPLASQNRRAVATAEEQKMMVALKHAGVPYVWQREFSTGKVNCKSREGIS